MAHRKKKIGAQLVEDEDYQLRHEKVAGIDIAKDKGDVCTRLPPAREGGRRRSRVEQDVPARARDILELGARLIADGVELVIMESTSDYWRIWFYLLESLGLTVALVNSSQARQLAGRPKTDRLDCQWLARLAEMGLLRPSFVPPPEVRALRDLARARVHLVRDRTRAWQRLEKLLEGALIKLSSELSSLAKVETSRLILDALAGGERDPKALSALALGALQPRRGDLEAALDVMAISPRHAMLIRVHLDRIDGLDRAVAAVEDEIAAALQAIPAAQGVNAAGEPSPDPGPDPAVLPADARPGRDPRRLPRPRQGGHRGDRPGHERLPHRGAPGLLGRARPGRPPVRPPPRQAEERPGQRLHQEPVHPGRQRRRQDRTRSSASGSAAWPVASALPGPRSPSPAPSSSSPGTC